MMWNLQSYPTTILNERMCHFWRGQNILWPSYIFSGGHDSSPLWLRACIPSVIVRMCLSRCAAVAELKLNLIGDVDVDIKTSAGVDYAGIAFLLRDRFHYDSATIYAFKACFRNRNPVRFQIWRPTGGASYHFIAEIAHTTVLENNTLPGIDTVSSKHQSTRHRYCILSLGTCHKTLTVNELTPHC